MMIQIDCMDFAASIGEILKVVDTENNEFSMMLYILHNILKASLCIDDSIDDEVDTEYIKNMRVFQSMFEGVSDTIKEEIIRLINECRDSICKGKKGRSMTITCDTIKILAGDDYQELKNECQRFHTELKKTQDMISIVTQLFNKELYDTDTSDETVEVMNKIKTIPRKKLTPVIRLIGFMIKCACIDTPVEDVPASDEDVPLTADDIDMLVDTALEGDSNEDEKKGLSTTTIIIIVVSVILLLLFLGFYIFNSHKLTKSS